MKNILNYKWIFLGFSGALMLLSLISIVIFGLKPGIDFTGGSLWQIRAGAGANEGMIIQSLKDLGAEDAVVYRETSSDSFLVKLKPTSEEEHQRYLKGLGEKFSPVEEMRFESIGPTIGDQLRSRAFTVVILVLCAISLYIAFSFRKVSKPIASWKYGIVTLITLFHDALIPLGLLAVLGKYKGIEIDTNFVVALLVIIGFSVHDTIVVFDRIRENILIHKGKKDFDVIVGESIAQTIARSINTSLTLILVLVAMLIFGASNLQLFVLVILVGTVMGTYSSIFVASPLLTILNKFSNIKTTRL